MRSTRGKHVKPDAATPCGSLGWHERLDRSISRVNEGIVGVVWADSVGAGIVRSALIRFSP
jgi:hypothetical protein